MRIKFMKCPHIKCQCRMHRLYVRNKEKRFVPIGWTCPDCGIMARDDVIRQ